MTSGERRVLTRSLIVLMLAGLGRVVADARRPPVDVLAHLPDRAAELDSAATAVARDEEARSRPLAEGERLDPNRASEAELDRLPGVGPALAGRIVAHRSTAGGFARVDDLARVSGIGPATVAKLRAHLEIRGSPSIRGVPVTGRSPTAPAAGELRALVDVNRADSAELLQVPGIGPALAGRILTLRRERGRLTTLEGLLEVRGIGDKTLARLRTHLTVGSDA
jgi:competence ComEA-like helix-hairpin-helix protein